MNLSRQKPEKLCQGAELEVLHIKSEYDMYSKSDSHAGEFLEKYHPLWPNPLLDVASASNSQKDKVFNVLCYNLKLKLSQTVFIQLIESFKDAFSLRKLPLSTCIQ